MQLVDWDGTVSLRAATMLPDVSMVGAGRLSGCQTARPEFQPAATEWQQATRLHGQSSIPRVPARSAHRPPGEHNWQSSFA